MRERISDIPILTNHFVAIYSARSNKKIAAVPKEYIELLQQHQWNGNIRELKNVIERSIILCDDKLTVEDLPLELQNRNSKSSQTKTLSAFELASAEKLHIQKVMNYTNGNKTKTADLLGIALTTLYRKLSEYGIE